MKKIAIYLAGTIKKGHEKVDETYWAPENLALIKKHLINYEVFFLDPGTRKDDIGNNFSVFGRDMLQVFSSHVVFVDARDKRGLGVGAEMMWAKVNRIPVVTWAPKNSHYNREQTTVLGVSVTNFIHPFVDALSDKIVENLAEGAAWIDFVCSHSDVKIKGIEHVGATMHYYIEEQLKDVDPMNELIRASVELRERMHRAHPQVIHTSP